MLRRNRAIVHQRQSRRAGSRQQDGDDQPGERVGVPAGIVKPQVSRQGSHGEPAQQNQRHDDRPELFIDGLELRRFQLSDDAADFRHVAGLGGVLAVWD